MQRPLAACAVFFLSGCSSVTDVTTAEQIRHESVWDAAGIVDYRFEHRLECECASEMTRPTVVTVIDGDIQSAFYVDDGASLSSVATQSLRTIDELFAFIEETRLRNPIFLSVSYDLELGYPTSIAIDYDRAIADDELVIRVSNLEPLSAIQFP